MTDKSSVSVHVVTLTEDWAKRGWTVERVGDMQCFVFDGRANIEEARKNLDPMAVRPRRSCLTALMHGIKDIFDRR